MAEPRRPEDDLPTPRPQPPDLPAAQGTAESEDDYWQRLAEYATGCATAAEELAAYAVACNEAIVRGRSGT